MNKPIIIGAGVAGLSCSNYLTDNNITNTVIEADKIGKLKICGEFFSSEAIPILKKWNIDILPFEKGNFYTKNYKYTFNFPKPCASFDRSNGELQLMQRAVKNGAKIIENLQVTDIIPAQYHNDIHQVFLSDGRVLETDTLVIATGKLPFLNKFVSQNISKEIKYAGIKAHFKNINIANELNMYLITGAYMGITNINPSTVNICCLSKKTLFDKFQSAENFIDFFIESNTNLKEIFKNATIENNWLTAYVPDFGKKKLPNLYNTYFIGDAAATIFPASGNGLSMGLTSGIMSANLIIENAYLNFKNDWKIRYTQRLRYAKFLNFLFMNPNLANLSFKIANQLPFIPKLIYKLTRD